MDIVRYNSSEHRQAVEALNARLQAIQCEFRFPTAEPTPGAGISYEHFVAGETGQVYGGYRIKHQQFFVRGEAVNLDNLQLPLSLALVDKKYSHVSAALLFDALSRNELLYCLGMGSQESGLVKMLTAAGWRHRVVPFYFRVRSANVFARNIRLPADKARLQRLLRLVGHARLAGLGLWAHGVLQGRRSDSVSSAWEVVSRFGSEVDELFERHARNYVLIGDRRSTTLDEWYPQAELNTSLTANSPLPPLRGERDRGEGGPHAGNTITTDQGARTPSPLPLSPEDGREGSTLDGSLVGADGGEKFHRLIVRATAGAKQPIIGWAVVLDTHMHEHKHFGDMRVGTLADCFAAPEHAAAVVAAADRYLSERGVDLIVSNQLHPAWCDALVRQGYRSGPSNFFFYFSEELAQRLEAHQNWESSMHINRGDGDGPIHL